VVENIIGIGVGSVGVLNNEKRIRSSTTTSIHPLPRPNENRTSTERSIFIDVIILLRNFATINYNTFYRMVGGGGRGTFRYEIYCSRKTGHRRN